MENDLRVAGSRRRARFADERKSEGITSAIIVPGETVMCPFVHDVVP
jgi:hypothetical protein